MAITIIPLGTFTVSAVSGSGKCGANLTWSYSDGTLTISGSGDMYDYQAGDSHWIDGKYSYPNFYEVIIKDGVTSIGAAAFYNSKNLQSVKLPSSLKSIGNMAFSNCDKLNKVSISSLQAWLNIQFESSLNNPLTEAKNLYINNVLATDIEIPYGVSKINDYVFYNCESIQNITISNSVTEIGNFAFYGCTGITKVNINNINSWCKIDFNNVTSNPLYYGKKLYINDVLATDIILSNGITSLFDYVFWNCENIKSIRLPNGITNIGSFAFYNCTGLTDVFLPDTLIKIGGSAFGSTNLRDVWYCGSSSDRSEIEGENLNSASWHYDSCDINKANIYDNACDRTCNVCGHIRTVPDHVYDNACDTTCNICGYIRTVPEHIYDNACDTTCNICGYMRTVPEHIYDNACDTTCNICGYIRTVPEHVYDDVCDNICNICGYKRIAPHKYDNDCDTTCNICGYERTAPHDYDNACDTTCNICGYIRTVPEHVYDNACDNDCNICAYERIPPHEYYNACDTTCNICGYMRTVPEHEYDNICDATCNICGYIRTVPEHVYDNACDTTCNICGYIRTVPEHVYDNVCDNDCNICAYERIPPHEYDNACDTTCNSCGLVRTVPNHVYSSACDATCDICGHERTAPHKYDNDCDTKCNICRYYRTIKHTYEKNPVWSFNSTNHWQKCYVCNNTTVEEEHVYDNDTDITCNICGYTRSIDNGFTVSESSKLESFNLPHLKTVPSGYTGIYTYSDLQKINNNPTGKYILMKDIDLYTDTENGISSSVISSDFSGIFNGNGYSISNLNISQTNKSNAGAGLFSHNKGTICNLKIKTFSIWSGTYNVNGSAISGAVAMQNSGIVTNCIVENPFISSFGGTTVASGGIVGINNPTGTIEYCMVIHNIKNYLISAIGIPESKTSDSYSGGICGKNLGNISCCGNKSNTASEAADYAYTGGISAYNSGKIENCYNTGTVLFYKNSKTSYYGSAVGYNDRSGSIENVYCNKDALCAQGDNTDNIRILLVHQNFGSVTNCYIEYLSIGGIDITVGEWGEKISNYQMKKADTYKGFDFNTVWIMGTYPELRAYDYSTCINDLNHSGGKATCQNKAVCEYCGISYGEKTEHSYDKWRTVYAPNCSKTGLKVHHCIYCSLEETENIPKDNRHAYTEGDDICYLCGHKWVLIAGDINGDEEIDGRDVITLCSYLANYDYDSGISSVDIFDGADANADGFVDGRDVIIVCAYLANYDYDTGSSTIVLG